MKTSFKILNILSCLLALVGPLLAVAAPLVSGTLSDAYVAAFGDESAPSLADPTGTSQLSFVFELGQCATSGSPIAVCGMANTGSPSIIADAVSLGPRDLYITGFSVDLMFGLNTFQSGEFTITFVIGGAEFYTSVATDGTTTNYDLITPILGSSGSSASGFIYAGGPALVGLNSGAGFGNITALVSLTLGDAPAGPNVVPEPQMLALVGLALAGMASTRRYQPRR